MNAITLRNLPPNLARIVQQRAKQKNTSVNKAVIELLEEPAAGKAKKKAPWHRKGVGSLLSTARKTGPF